MKLTLLFLLGFAGSALCADSVEPVREFLRHLKEITLPQQELECPNYDYYLDQSIWLQSLLQKIQADPEATGLLIRIRDGFYREDGPYFYGMLQAAATNPKERDAFIRGLKYEKGVSWFPGWDLVWEKLVSGSDKVSFGKTQLKLDIDAFESKLEQFGLPKTDFSKLESKNLDIYEAYFKFFVVSNSILPPLIAFLFGYYTEKSLKNLTEQDLRELLAKLILFLSDKERGALWFIQAAAPRS